MTFDRTADKQSRSRTALATVGACIIGGGMLGVLCVLVNPLFLLAAVPITLAGLWAIRDARRGLGLMIIVIALLPRIASPVSIGFKPTLLDATILLTIAGYFLWRKAPIRVTPGALTLPLIALITVACATFILGSANGAITSLVLRRFGELVISLAFVFVLIALLHDFALLVRVARWVIYAAAASAFVALVLYFAPVSLVTRLLGALRPFGYPTGEEVIRYVRDDPSLLKRATGLWIDPNAFAGFLLMSGALTLPQLFARNRVLPRAHAWLAMVLISLALVLTISRSAMLGLGLAAVVVGFLRQRRIFLLLVLVAICALVLPQTQDLILHFADGFAGRDLSTQMRFGEYKDAFRLIERYPILGVGFITTPDIDLYIGVSSMYLLIAQQMGLVGLSVFLLCMAALFGDAVRAWGSIWVDEQRATIWLGALAAVFAALVSGVFDHYFFNIDFHNSVMHFWLFVSIAVAAQTNIGVVNIKH